MITLPPEILKTLIQVVQNFLSKKIKCVIRRRPSQTTFVTKKWNVTQNLHINLII